MTDQNQPPQDSPHPGVSTEDLERWDREHVWHGFTQMAEYQPLIFSHGEGCVLTDIQGQQYIDAISSLWCNVHGHRHPALDEAIRQQLDRVAHVTALGSSNPTTIELAKKLTEITPAGLDHVFFSDSGATAVEAGLKMALQYWTQCADRQPNRTRYVALGQAYHGDTIGSVSLGGMERFHNVFGPLLFRPLRVPVPDTYRIPEGVRRENVCGHYLVQLERVLEKNHDSVAAVVIEPLVQGAAGMVMHPPGFLKGVRELTQSRGILMIADEVAVGFGRTGRMFACEHEEVVPDILCLGKGISGGYLPVAATIASTRVWDAFLGTHADSKTFYHGHTYGGNPLGAAVALANLQLFAQEDTIATIQPKIQHLENRLQEFVNLPFVGDVRQKGLMVGIELVAETRTKEAFPWQARCGDKVCAAARERGVLIRPLGDVLVLMPPLAITIGQLDTILDVLREVIQQHDVWVPGSLAS